MGEKRKTGVIDTINGIGITQNDIDSARDRQQILADGGDPYKNIVSPQTQSGLDALIVEKHGWND